MKKLTFLVSMMAISSSALASETAGKNSVCLLGGLEYSLGIRFAIDADTTYHCNEDGAWQVDHNAAHVNHATCMHDNKLYSVGSVINNTEKRSTVCNEQRVWEALK